MSLEFTHQLNEIITNYGTYLKALLILILGIRISIFIKNRLKKSFQHKASPQQSMMMQKGVYYGLIILTLTWCLHVLGFSISVILGAAGVLSVAIGFAAQTSVSNIISGIFLLAEKPCEIDDVIEVSGVTGIVTSVDLLSIKLKTFDNRFIRIPNESVLQANLTNLSKFPTRRIDLQFGIAYKENIETVKEILFDLAKNQSLCLTDPEPSFYFLGFGDSSIDLQFSVWTKKENFLDLKNIMYLSIKKTFDEKNIEMPFPHRSIGAMSITDPIPIKISNS